MNVSRQCIREFFYGKIHKNSQRLIFENGYLQGFCEKLIKSLKSFGKVI